MTRAVGLVRVAVIVCNLLAGWTAASRAADPPATRHPLDPLTKDEIQSAMAVLVAARKVSTQSRFPLVTLRDPAKVEVLKGSRALPREAFLVVYERASNRTFEAVVDVRRKVLASWKEVRDVQPALMIEDFAILEEVVRGDSRWREALQKRGIKDPREVAVVPWPAGEHGVKEAEGHRLLSAVAFLKGRERNAYARPIEGPVAVVDLNTRQVLQFFDTGVVPISRDVGDYDRPVKARKAPRPLQIVQPQGHSFELHGHEVRWQNWRFRYALHPREGLVLHTVGYEDQGRVRSVLYRGSLSELFVPYGDPGPGWYFRNVFDAGEVGLGWMSSPLEPLADAPDNATFLPAVFANEQGAPYDVPRAIALYERDGGILWKHVDAQGNESRRARQLVLASVATSGNYDYGFNWIFNQDGSLEIEVLLTGIMSVKGVAGGGHEMASHGHLVAPNVEAVHHQHFFCFRLDCDIDGAGNNSVVEMNTELLPRAAGAPPRQAMAMRETVLRNEQEARRQLSLATARKWKVVNTAVKNALGMPVGYAVLPGENSVPYVHPDSLLGTRTAFTRAHLWVTPYDRDELYACGAYIHRGKAEDGLGKWTLANRPVENQDVVLWYTLGVTHIPRPEEWPVMPVHRAGFKLVPSGFFARNPALDLPRPERPRGTPRP